jgi:single-strand DNA-binding protein
MARSINKLILVGHVGRDPEVQSTANGHKVAHFSLATNRRIQRDSGFEERTEWHRLTVWNRLAELAEEYIRKGDRLYVEGRTRTSPAPRRPGSRAASRTRGSGSAGSARASRPAASRSPPAYAPRRRPDRSTGTGSCAPAPSGTSRTCGRGTRAAPATRRSPRCPRLRAGEALAERGAVPVATIDRRVQRQLRRRHPAQRPHRVHRLAHLVRDLLVRRRPAQQLRQRRLRPRQLHQVRVLVQRDPDRARLLRQRLQHRLADPPHGVRDELDALVRDRTS